MSSKRDKRNQMNGVKLVESLKGKSGSAICFRKKIWNLPASSLMGVDQVQCSIRCGLQSIIRICSLGPTERWLEHAAWRFSHEIANEKALYTGISGNFLREYASHAVRDDIVDRNQCATWLGYTNSYFFNTRYNSRDIKNS